MLAWFIRCLQIVLARECLAIWILRMRGQSWIHVNTETMHHNLKINQTYCPDTILTWWYRTYWRLYRVVTFDRDEIFPVIFCSIKITFFPLSHPESGREKFPLNYNHKCNEAWCNNLSFHYCGIPNSKFASKAKDHRNIPPQSWHIS